MPRQRNHPFFRTLRRLPAKEQKRFLRWLESDLFTERKGLGKLADDLAQNKKSEAVPEATPLQLTYLRKELDNFLAVLELQKKDVSWHRLLIRAHENLSDFPRAQKLRQQYLKKDYGTQDPHDQYLEKQSLYHDEFTHQNFNQPDNFLATVLPKEQFLDRYFLLAKLRQACQLASFKVMYNSEIELPFLETALQQITLDPKWLQDPLITLYYRAYRLIDTGSQVEADQLFDLLSSRKEWLRNSALRELYKVLLNFCVRQMNQGNTEFTRLCFSLYQLGLSEGILYKNGKLSGITFLNIVINALKVQEYDWSKTFMATEVDKLNSSDKNSIYPYCQANLHYDLGELATAASWLHRFDFSARTSSIQLQARVTFTKIYFDQKNYDLLDSHLNSFAVYLSRHKELGYQREIGLNFIRLCRRLLALPIHLTEVQSSKVVEEISTLPIASYRNWLLARLPK